MSTGSGVEKIDDEVDQHEGRGDEEHAPLHQRIVARLDGPHHHGAEPRPGEDGFGQYRSGQQLRIGKPAQRDHRQHRVGQRVAQHDAPLARAFGARRADEILAEHVEQARAHITGVGAEAHDSQRRNRQQQVPPLRN